jgi:hypothetical protein
MPEIDSFNINRGGVEINCPKKGRGNGSEPFVLKRMGQWKVYPQSILGDPMWSPSGQPS